MDSWDHLPLEDYLLWRNAENILEPIIYEDLSSDDASAFEAMITQGIKRAKMDLSQEKAIN